MDDGDLIGRNCVDGVGILLICVAEELEFKEMGTVT
jgi:hypothetical protein